MFKKSLFFILSILYVPCAFCIGTFTLVIDPGHGGKDSGTLRGQYVEKKIVLAVALAFGKLVENNMSDVNVLYTRKSDVFVPLDKRASLANRNKANLFISIHVNSTGAKTTSVSGIETYALGFSKSAANLEVAKRENEVVKYEDNYKQKYEGFDPDSPESYIIFEFMSTEFLNQSLEFASSVQRNMKNTAKRNDRGARQDNFLVLREAGMPAVLVELGFINNSSDATFISSAEGQKKLAESLYGAFREYKKKYDTRLGGNGVSSTSVKPTAEAVTAQVTTPEAATPKVATPEVTTPVVSTTSKVATPAAKTNSQPKPVATPTTKSATPTTKSTGVKNGEVEYRVQFYYSKEILNSSSPKLKGIPNVSYYKDGNGYKYTAGSTTNFNEAVNLQKEIRKKYKDAFVVRFKDGKRQ